MKPTLIALLLCCTFVYPLIAQQQIDPCGTNDAERELLEKHPEQILKIEQFDNYIKDFVAQYAAIHPSQRRGQVYIIPVVVHVLHHYGQEYISDEQIYNAMEILNDDFRKRNADISEVIPEFQGITADCEIEFRLARFDPWRNPTNGIDRVHSFETYQGTNNSKLKPWPRDLYLNIWVTALVQQSSPTTRTLAFGTPPAAVDGQLGLYDGILASFDCVGNIGVGNPLFSRTLTHEAGHYLGLRHTWGDELGTCGDDGVHDTPITDGGFDCVLYEHSCTPDTAPIIENTQNFMNYSQCPRMFTEGQKIAMIGALNSDVAHRNNLWQESTLQFTGADVSTNENTAPPIADFNAPVRMACLNELVSFKDFSWRGPIAQWEWTFSNATPSTSTAQNPSVSFNTPGWQTVSLKVTSIIGQHEKVKDHYIYVTDTTLPGSPSFSEDFENGHHFADNWIVNNLDSNNTSWRISAAASYSGGACLMLNSFNGSYDRDEVVTPPYDMLAVPANQKELSFQYSYASTSISSEEVNDTLTVYYAGCGSNWTQVYRVSGTQLVTAGSYIGNFVPDRSNLWRQVTIPLPTAIENERNVRFKFVFANSGNANNIYLDNINVDKEYTSVPSQQLASLNVYPVPSSGSFNVELSAVEASPVQIELFDMVGKNLSSQKHLLAAGTSIIPMQFDLPVGSYLLSILDGNGERVTRKLAILR